MSVKSRYINIISQKLSLLYSFKIEIATLLLVSKSSPALIFNKNFIFELKKMQIMFSALLGIMRYMDCIYKIFLLVVKKRYQLNFSLTLILFHLQKPDGISTAPNILHLAHFCFNCQHIV